jgi:antitoxin component YwqK of YwqJK toxin-antitoxin module
MSVELKCLQSFWENGKLKSEEFFNSEGKRHNAAGPAARRWHANGQLASKSHYLNGKWHATWPLISEEYWLNGQKPKAEWEAKVNPAPCDGKVVEIEGRRYKLVAE